HYHLGVALEKKGDLRGAEESYTTAVTVQDPACENLQDAWEARCNIRIRLGRADDATKDCEKCVAISKHTATGQACQPRLQKLPAAGGPLSAPNATANTP